MTIGTLKGHARPSAALRARLGLPLSIEQILNRAEAVDALACLLTEAIEKNQTKDGRIDMRTVAAHVLAEMKRNQR